MFELSLAVFVPENVTVLKEVLSKGRKRRERRRVRGGGVEEKRGGGGEEEKQC